MRSLSERRRGIASVWAVVVLSVLALIVGWIVRGFAGIPMRKDTRA